MAYTGVSGHIALGQIGLLTDLPPGDIPRGALILANNISYETGTITKAPGSSQYNTQVLPAGIVAVIDWWPSNISQRLIAACSNGSIYRDIGDRLFSSATAIATGLGTLTPRSMFVQGGNETDGNEKKLFFFSPNNQLQVLEGDGTAFAEVDNPAADWVNPNFPTVGLIHRNRLWAFAGQRAYASETDDHEDFTGAGILTQSIFPGEGGDVIGAHIFRGKIFVFKEGGYVYSLNDDDVDSDNWYWQRIASSFGLASPHGIVEAGNDMIAVNESGSPVSYNAVESLGEVEGADLLRLLQIEDYFRRVTSVSGVSVMHALYYEAKKQVFFTWRDSYRTTNNLLFHIDFSKQNPRPALWDKDSADCLALRKDAGGIQRPIYGASDGYIYLMDQEDRLVGGSAYTGEFKIGHTDFRYLDEKIANKNKIFDFLSVEFKPQGSWNLSVDVYIDGTLSETIEFLMDVRDDGLDTFTLDTDPLGREETQTIRKPLHGSGRRISLRCRQAGSNQNFSVASLTVDFRVSGEQATRV